MRGRALFSRRPLSGSICRLAGLAGIWAAVLVSSAALFAADPVRYDFAGDTDDGWTRYDPLGGLGAGERAIYSVSNGMYRIQALPSPNPSLAGPGRAGSYLGQQAYSDFYIAVDITDWNPSMHQAFGILARVQQVGLQTTRGYAFTFDTGSRPGEQDMDISKLTAESPTGLASHTGSIRLTRGEAYRMVFIGQGSTLEGRIYSRTNLMTPLYTLAVIDTTYPSGYAGLVVYDNSGGPGSGDATFDNFLVTVKEPPRLNLSHSEQGDIILTWPLGYSDWRLEETTAVQSGWTPVSSSSFFEDVDKIIYYPPDTSGTRFFRLAK